MHFAALPRDSPPRVGLLFPGGVGGATSTAGSSATCSPDGTDFNLLLVETGRGPYFDKVRQQRVCHAAFVAAEGAPRAHRGI